jgi:hypothetical protein
VQPSVLSEDTNTHKLNDILEDFIDTLQESYSHTCPTILRTSEKIKIANEAHNKCRWCLSNTDNHLCMKCIRIKEHWTGNKEQPIEDYLPECFGK